MSVSSEPGLDRPLEQALFDLVSWTRQLKVTKGLDSESSGRRAPSDVITVAHIEQLKNDIAALIDVESKRSFWSGIGVNTLFFILGAAAGIATDTIKGVGLWPF